MAVGFRSLNHAQLLNDVCYSPDVVEPQQWLIYFISKPLIGSLEHIPILPAQIRSLREDNTSHKSAPSTPVSATASRKKDVNSFNELLTLFPLIARQMQGGLDDIFVRFARSFEKPLPPSPPSSAVPSVSSPSSSIGGDEITGVSFASDRPKNSEFRIVRAVADQLSIRKALEIAIASAIELFQKVDPSQLTLIASTTNLTGTAVERLIERYIMEQLHDTLLFPRVCSTKREEDEELESKIKAMENVDLTQVGIPSLDQRAKSGLVKRLTKGIENFRKIGSAKSPHAMMEILLDTAQSLTRIDEISSSDDNGARSSEKDSLENGNTTIVTMNADMLVTLLLIVVIRAKVPCLSACLSYMRNYVFVDDVEQGEIGYISSTLEAVLYHIVQDNDQLSLASSKNRDLWRCVKKGNVEGVRFFLEPSDTDGQTEGVGDESSGDSGSYLGHASNVEEKFNGNSSDTSNDEDMGANTSLVFPPSLELGHGDPTDNERGSDERNIDANTSEGESVEDPQNTADDLSYIPPPPSGGHPLSTNPDYQDGPTDTQVAKDMEDLSLGRSEELAPLAPRNTLDSVSNFSDILSETINGAGKGKENEGFPTSGIFTKRMVIPTSASMVSLATTIRDNMALPQLSRTHTTMSHNTSASQKADITSIEKLSKSRNANGDSVLMMAVQDRQPEVLRYLLDCPYFPLAFVLDDENQDGTTLLCAAVQLQNIEVVEILLRVLLKLPEAALKEYFYRADNAGRTMGHYLFK